MRNIFIFLFILIISVPAFALDRTILNFTDKEYYTILTDENGVEKKIDIHPNANIETNYKLALSTYFLNIIGQSGVAQADCSGDGSFFWEIDSLTIGSGDPQGCADGADLVGTKYGGSDVTIGGGIMSVVDSGGGYDYVEFDVTGEDHVKGDMGTIFIKVYVTDVPYYNEFVKIYVNGSHYIRLRRGAGSHIHGQIVSDSGANVQIDSLFIMGGYTYIVRLSWELNRATADIELELMDGSYNTLGTPDSDEDNWSDPGSPANIFVGNNTNYSSGDFDIDWIHIYKVWTDTDSGAP